jgi:3-oxoacyl-[acyl-carrier-protein] synthase-3
MTQTLRTLITGLGHYHPENIIDNEFFNQLDIGSDAQWVAERTGIQKRHSVLTEADLLALRRNEKTLNQLRADGRVMSIATMASRAWDLLKERRPNAADNLEVLMCGTSVPDFDIPANACTISHAIGAECTSFDVNSACSSFVVNLHVARSYLAGHGAAKAAIFIPERYSLRLDYNDRSSCVLFGDACGAALLERSTATEGFEVIDTLVVSAPSKYDLIQIPVAGCFNQVGHAVQKFAISRTIEITQEVLRRNGFGVKDISYLIGHQANLRMLTAAVAKLGLSEDKHLHNVEAYGNQGGAGSLSVISMNYDRFKSGDLIVVSVVGAGLTWASALLRKL